MNKTITFILFVLSFAFLLNDRGHATGITITDTIDATADNTLYEDAEGLLSNGFGEYLFAGSTNNGFKKRGLIFFDIQYRIPPGAVINDVKVRMYMSRTISGNTPVELYKVDNKYWSEGTSDAFGEEGSGATAEMYDATWLHNNYSSEFWLNPGGDYVPTITASTDVNSIGYYEWSSAQMINDVNSWINFDLNNFGWIIISDETSSPTTKRFNSTQNPNLETRPKLIINYTINSPSLIFSAMTEGLYHGNKGSYVYYDSLRVFLKNSFPPYSTVDSVFKMHAFLSGISFPNASAGSYYIALKHRNSIETWSNVPKLFTIGSAVTHYFTNNDSLAYGNNLIFEEGFYCIYSGDVDQNGIIDGSDAGLIDNDIANFTTGYFASDLDGNLVTDGTDGAICDNNVYNFVTKIVP